MSKKEVLLMLRDCVVGVCLVLTITVALNYGMKKQAQADRKVKAQLLMDKVIRDKQDEKAAAYDYLIGTTNPDEVLKEAEERAKEELVNGTVTEVNAG